MFFFESPGNLGIILFKIIQDFVGEFTCFDVVHHRIFSRATFWHPIRRNEKKNCHEKNNPGWLG